jgi:hypothetical protein
MRQGALYSWRATGSTWMWAISTRVMLQPRLKPGQRYRTTCCGLEFDSRTDSTGSTLRSKFALLYTRKDSQKGVQHLVQASTVCSTSSMVSKGLPSISKGLLSKWTARPSRFSARGQSSTRYLISRCAQNQGPPLGVYVRWFMMGTQWAYT